MLSVNMNPLNFSILPFKSHIFVAAGALFNYNTHCGTELSISDKKNVHVYT